MVHYTGHRIASRDGSGLHPGAEAAVAQSIGARLDAFPVTTAFGSLASGADILFAEAFTLRGVALHVWLPFEICRFRDVSVRPAGALWVARFDSLLPAASVTILQPRLLGEAAFAACSQAAMQAALAAAAAQQAQALQLAVWNGAPSGSTAGTAADIAAWHALGLATVIVATGGHLPE